LALIGCILMTAQASWHRFILFRAHFS